MPIRPPIRPETPDDLSEESARLARFLFRPIVFQQPDRAVHPPSWLEHIPFAFWIVEALQPAMLVELGTQSGVSYAAFAQAIQTLALPTAAYAVDTWRGDVQAGFYDESVFTEWSAYHDRHFSGFSRLIRSTFDEAVQHFPDASIDLLHIDGCHTYDAAAADFRRWRQKLSRRSVMLLHDINVRERDFGAWRLWEELKGQFPSFEFLHGHGLGVLGTGPDQPEPLQWLFSNTAGSEPTSLIRQFFSQLGGGVSARYGTSEIEKEVRADLVATSTELARAIRAASEKGASLARSTDELLRLRDERSSLMMRLDAREAEGARTALLLSNLEARSALQLSSLEARLTSEREEHAESRRHAAQVLVELLTRLGRAKAEAELATANPGTTIAGRASLAPVTLDPLANLTRFRRLARTARALGLLSARRLTMRSLRQFVFKPGRFREARVILGSGLFDEAYYREQYADVAANQELSPLAHFVLQGAFEGRSPNPLFDSVYYLKHHPHVAASGVNPLLHYVSRPLGERSPHPLFDVPFYLSENPDVRSAGVEPLRHFLAFGIADGRNPNPFFDCAYYLQRYPDVSATGTNPLVHYARNGWRECRRPSAAFDPEYYLAENPDVRALEQDPLAHYLEHGRLECRPIVAPGEPAATLPEIADQWPLVRLKVRALAPAPAERPTVLCLSHVMPWPPRAGNEYRIHRMLCWLRDQGYRIVPVIAPLPGEDVEAGALQSLADQFSNAVLCHRDGRIEYVLGDVPDVLATLGGEFTRPASLLLDERSVPGHEGQLLGIDRVFCHDTLVTTVLRLHQVLGRYVLLAEYIWMSRILPLISGDVLKVIDTIDVFSSKREKVLQFGIDDLHVEPEEEIRRLRHADLIIAIQDDERRALQKLLPDSTIVTAGVDFNVVEDAGVPAGRRVFLVASDNPMNRKGLLDFLRFAWPHIRGEVPDAELLVAGRIIRALETDVPGVVRLGPIADLEPYYRQCRLVINPAVAGTGLKIKTLEALGHLRPLVSWPNGTDGLPPELSALCTTVRDWFEFARSVAGLLAADQPRLFSPAERETIVRLTSPEAAYRGMTDAIAEGLRRG